MFFNGFENPKLAAIRLLRSQGCCSTASEGDQQYENDQPVTQLQNLLRYKEELQAKVSHQRSRMSEIPCAIELASEIQQLQQIIQGLSRENKQRIRYLEQTMNEASSTCEATIEDQQQQRIVNQKLQGQYSQLMKKLEKVNSRNAILVNKLVNF